MLMHFYRLVHSPSDSDSAGHQSVLPAFSEKKLVLAAPKGHVSMFSVLFQKPVAMMNSVREINENEITIATISDSFSELFLSCLYVAWAST